jgi:hypothetical protein
MARKGTSAVAIAAGLVASLLAPAAQALVIGDFEGSLDGWSTSGSVSTTTDFQGVLPTLGSEFLQLRTQGSTSTDAALAAFFDLTGGAIDALSPSGNDASEGSGALLLLTANAGDELSFDFNLVTREDASRSLDYRDFFFSTIQDGSGEVVREDVDAMPRLATSNPNWLQSGWQSVTYTFPTAGTYTIGFGVVDALDSRVETRLFLDRIRHVPEPSTGAMVSLGLLGIALRRRPVR